MPKTNTVRRRTRLVLFAGMLLAAIGVCDLRALPTYLVSFGAGFLLGQSTVPVTTECFRNGDPIDCADLPF